MKKIIFLPILFLLVACGGVSGVSKEDVTKVCLTISSSYVDSQLRQGIFKEDPRFKMLLVELYEKQGTTDYTYIDIISRSKYNSIALQAIAENRRNPNFYGSCLKNLSEEFSVD